MSSTLRIIRLGDQVFLVCIERTAQFVRDKIECLLDGREISAPFSFVDLKLDNGAFRTVIAFKIAATDEAQQSPSLSIRLDPEGQSEEWGEIIARSAPFNAGELLDNLILDGTARLARLLFDFCRIHFHLKSDPRFVQAARSFAQRLTSPSDSLSRIGVTPSLAMAAGHSPSNTGALRSILIVGSTEVDNPEFPIFSQPETEADASAQFQLLFDRRALATPFFILVFGDRGIAALAVPVPVGTPSLILAWLQMNPPAVAAFRRYLTSGIAVRLAEEPVGAAMLREFQLLYPVAPLALREPDRAVGGEIEFAISSDAGLFLAGWLHDPSQLIARFRVLSPFGTHCSFTAPIHRFPREDIAKLYPSPARASSSAAMGFIVFLRGFKEPVPALQYRVEITLQSGTALELVSPLLTAGHAQARDSILQAIPTRHVSREALLHTVAPPVEALHRSFMAARFPPEVTVYGGGATDRPANASLIVPVYRNLEFLRAQHAALALDPETRDTELIYVLDSPEQRPVMDRLLRALYATYGLPCRLAVMPVNYGFAAACNAGATLATSPLLLALNSDVVPAAPGWLGRLAAAMNVSPQIAAVGAKLLYEDDSLQHAGLYFAQDTDGWWHNHHYHKGYPRDYPEANQARYVPAVTAAVMLLRRTAFTEVGGFSEDYVIGDYEDSDLCLKLRAAGYDIWYEPTAELYHFERRSMPMNSAYWRSNASEYNRMLHELRWRAAMERLIGADLQPVAAMNQRRRGMAQFKRVDERLSRGGSTRRSSAGGTAKAR